MYKRQLKRCDLELAGVASASYASALSSLVEDEKELGTPVKEEQQLFEVIMKLKSKLEEVHTTMEEESEDYNPEFDAASFT